MQENVQIREVQTRSGRLFRNKFNHDMIQIWLQILTLRGTFAGVFDGDASPLALRFKIVLPNRDFRLATGHQKKWLGIVLVLWSNDEFSQRPGFDLRIGGAFDAVDESVVYVNVHWPHSIPNQKFSLQTSLKSFSAQETPMKSNPIRN